MEHVEYIVEQFGGMTAMAKALGHKHPTTVQGWVNSGRIPHWRHHEVKAAAKRKKISLDPPEAVAAE